MRFDVKTRRATRSLTHTSLAQASLIALTAITAGACDPTTGSSPKRALPIEAQQAQQALSPQEPINPFQLLKLTRPSFSVMERVPRLQALHELTRVASREELELGRDLFQLAWARALAPLGELNEVTSIASLLIEGRSPHSDAARALLIKVAPCSTAEAELKALKREASHKTSERERLLRQELSWAQRCAPNALEALHERISAGSPLLAQELTLPSPQLTPDEALKRALALEGGRAYHAALQALDALLKRELSASLSWEARYERARIQVERVREGFKESALQLDALAREPRPPSKQRWRQARLLSAKAWSKARDPKRSRAVYQDLIREWPHSAEGKSARFMLAFERYEAGAWREALKGFAKLCRHQGELKRAQKLKGLAPKRGWERAAEWYYAWSLYQLNPSSAAPFLAYQAGEGAPTSEEGRRAAYWSARAYEKREPERARALRAALLKADPLDWYSLLLRARYPQEAPSLTPLGLSREPELSLELPPEALTPLKRALIAERLSLTDLLPLERAQAREALRSTLKTLTTHERLELLLWGRRAGLVELALRTGVALNPKLLTSLPSPSDALWWQLAYPWAFSAPLREASEREGVSEAVLLSFIRKESAFQPSAESHAHARGLMQLLDKTARHLMEMSATSSAPQAPELFDPNINLTLGARYVHALSERYQGQLPLVAIAYNAGPTHLNTWLKASERWGRSKRGAPRAEVDLALFVERVPFKEARAYVKRLMKTYAVYELLYGESNSASLNSLLTPTIKTKVERGVSF